MRHLILFSLITAYLFSVGCASVTRGGKESFVIETDPAGVRASSSQGWSCMTPCSMKIKRRSEFVVTLEKEGYETLRTTVTSSIDTAGGTAMAGNILLGGVVGAGIDGITGAMHSHKPNPLVVKLEKIDD